MQPFMQLQQCDAGDDGSPAQNPWIDVPRESWATRMERPSAEPGVHTHRSTGLDPSMILSLTQPVACVSCSLLLCAPVKPVLSCLAEPRISTRACFCQPCLAVLGTLPSSPTLRLGGPQDLPLSGYTSQTVHTQQVFCALVTTTDRAAA